jgi:hypothetical protein
MLKVNNNKILEEESLRALNEELFIAEFLEILFGAKIDLELNNFASMETQRGFSGLHRLKNSEGLNFYFKFSGMTTPEDPFQHFMQLINLSSALHRAQISEKFLGFYFADPDRDFESLQFREYRISGPGFTKASLALALPGNFNIFYTDKSPRADAPSAENELPTVSLNLGEIEIDLNSFMSIKEGMQIECELPESFLASLALGSEKFARVKASLSGQKLFLTVTNMATL